MRRKFIVITFLSVLSVVSIFAQKKKLPQADKKMLEAYRISGQIITERIIAEDPSNKDILDNITENDLIVIDGEFDHIHLVLPSLELPFIKVDHDQLQKMEFKPGQTVFVNCASSFPPAQAKRLASFVAKGGQLITSDWALKYVLETGFPGYVGGNGRYTTDDVVRIETVDTEDPVIKGFLDEETNPVWWLEGISYPIRVLNKDKVKVLVRSEELKDRYGEDAVLVRFEYGKGVVYHMISHFYLQRTEIRDVVQEEKAEKYIIVKGGTRNKRILQDARQLNYGQIQAANTSSEFIMRAVINHKKKSYQ
ncbi:MAG: hypothetical protein LBV72_16495 [Tannerella sp.]|jgi:hypothetical protein|nr:hypothetical protein [Tannerella sp.]